MNQFEVAQGAAGWEANRVEVAREVRIEAGQAEVRRVVRLPVARLGP